MCDITACCTLVHAYNKQHLDESLVGGSFLKFNITTVQVMFH
jgi:hypothetical protein